MSFSLLFTLSFSISSFFSASISYTHSLYIDFSPSLFVSLSFPSFSISFLFVYYFLFYTDFNIIYHYRVYEIESFKFIKLYLKSLSLLRSLSLSLMLALLSFFSLQSFETVSNSIMIALLCLATHKGDCQQRLRAEIESVMPHGNDVSYVSVEHLQQLRYLDAFVNEALRLLATVPMNLRHVSRDFQLAGRDAIVPQNTIIVLDTFSMQRDTAWWGEKATQFEPQRFLQQQQELLQKEEELEQEQVLHGQSKYTPTRRHSYSFLPFSKGLRTCIGKEI